MVYGLSMEKFHIEPMTAPPGSDDYLPCDEQHATRWYVSKALYGWGWTNYGWFDSRELAEAYVEDRLADHIQKLNYDRAAKALFEAQTFNHPRGHIPTWDNQPEVIKDVWRRKVSERADKFTWRDGDLEHH